jgi:phage shock protein C
MPADARFCSACGATAIPGAVPPQHRQLLRPRAGRMIAGICQALANQYNWDINLVRVLTVVLGVVVFPLPEIAYVIAWILIPEEPLFLPPGVQYTPPSGS